MSAGFWNRGGGGEVERVDFTGVDFIGVDFTRVDLIGVDFLQFFMRGSGALFFESG